MSMLSAQNLSFGYPGRPLLLDDFSLSLASGEIVGLAGTSGCGKSTVARLLTGHLRPLGGTITVDGKARHAGLHPVQYLDQSPLTAVNPRWRIGRIVHEAWQPDEATREALGVSRHWYDRYPHEISGGELQRVVILRALAPAVRFLVADEITAMLDLITQAKIWRFLRSRVSGGLGILTISHDRALLDRLARKIIEL